MKALRFHGKQHVRVDGIVESAPGPGQVKLRNHYAGICGSDLHVYFEPQSVGVDGSRPHRLTGATLPRVLGHEFSCEVAEVGVDATGVDLGGPGRRVARVLLPHVRRVSRGCAERVRQARIPRTQQRRGGMAEFTTVAAEKSIAFRTVSTPGRVRSSRPWRSHRTPWTCPAPTGRCAALIFGAGPIGIGAWFALRARGVETINVAEPNADRRAAIWGSEPTRW